MERTLVLIKPDAVKKQVWFNIMKLYQDSGLEIAQARIFTPFPLGMARDLYREHEGKDFYWELMGFMTQGTVIALCITGRDDTVAFVRELNGATKPSEAALYTVRKRWGTDGCKNAVHGSANAIAAERELKIVFEKYLVAVQEA